MKLLTIVSRMKLVPILLVSSVTFSHAYAAEQLASKEVLLDNDHVQVVRLIYPSGFESGMHTHEFPNRVAYFVSGGKLELMSEDETEDHQIIEVNDGDTVFAPGNTHNVKNIGMTEVVIIETEIK